MLAVATPMRAAPMAAGGGAMHGLCPLCNTNSSDDHAVPKMPLCGIPACAGAVLLAALPQLAATLMMTRTEYPGSPATSLSGNTPRAEPPPPRTILAR